MRPGGGGGGIITTGGGYPTQPVPQPGQPGQPGFGGGYSGPSILQPIISPIMQPGVPQPGGGVVSGSGMSMAPPPPARESTYPVDAPMTWNDPPAIVAKKVV